MKKWISALLAAMMCLSLGACTIGETDGEQTEPSLQTQPTEAQPGSVRILNKDPSLQQVWEALAGEYETLTGTKVTVLTSDQDQQPTLREVAGVEELPEHCADLSGSEVCAQLASWELTLRDEQGRVCAVAAEAEVYGLVYNSTLLAKTSNTRGDINSFTDLTEVVYSITDKQQDLGFSAFVRVAAEPLFLTRLAALTEDARSLLDLIINNTTCELHLLEDCTQEEALQDFLEGKAVFFLAGSREQETLMELGSRNTGVLPVYTGVGNEENQSLCVAASRYWCVDQDQPETDVQATVDFLNFLVKPRADGSVPADDLERMAPYRRAARVSNVLESVFRNDLAAGKEPVVCRYVEAAPQALAQALLNYADNPSDDNWNSILQIIETKG